VCDWRHVCSQGTGSSGEELASATVGDCPEPLTLCDAHCFDTTIDASNCGECGKECRIATIEGAAVGFCEDGACAATLFDCTSQGESCQTICQRLGTLCAENECAGSTAWSFDGMQACEDMLEPIAYPGSCQDVLPPDAPARCCCAQP
jgi:hypothetical protein